MVPAAGESWAGSSGTVATDPPPHALNAAATKTAVCRTRDIGVIMGKTSA
jgi:hypothetical protein